MGKQIEQPSEKISKQEVSPKITQSSASGFLKKYGTSHSQDEVTVSTSFGDIKIRLYKNTPLHRANFLYLTEQDYFDNTWFYRVSEGHVIQAGNTDGRETVRKREALGDYRVPAEMGRGNYHKRGAVAAARPYKGNPEKSSDPFEFYIVLGKSYSRAELKLLAQKHEMNLGPAQLDFYDNRPGAPHLDGEHTVFGEVIEGMDVVEEISKVRVDQGEWPLMNIPIEIKVN